MLSIKRCLTAFLMLSCSYLYAGAMGPFCTRGEVTLPCSGSAWDVDLGALYLRPGLNGYNFITVVTDSNGLSHAINVDEAYAFGFKIEGSYHFNTGNDLDVNWLHVNSGPYKSFVFSGIPGAGVTQSVEFRNKVQPKWNAVNIELGQRIFLSDLKPLRIHGGFQYANISLASTIQAINPDSVRRFHIIYQGVGPRMGADAIYAWSNGLGIHANAAGSLLFGHNSFQHETSGSPFEVVANISGSQAILVPELEGKLGASYSLGLPQGTLNFDAGWLWYNYFDPLCYVSLASNRHGTPYLSNFSLTGPYFELKWKSDV